eukprot:TRINITY_DN7253_c0_g1_i1.p1 TRINITY_DN7253_c0_g1~~TRINITY_DN7253_c0_g1_i1.p1  ORF type:complete len:220 (-),score=-19.14 TRINITY_DN7253_c0_g1_i1:240-899(-)
MCRWWMRWNWRRRRSLRWMRCPRHCRRRRGGGWGRFAARAGWMGGGSRLLPSRLREGLGVGGVLAYGLPWIGRCRVASTRPTPDPSLAGRGDESAYSQIGRTEGVGQEFGEGVAGDRVAFGCAAMDHQVAAAELGGFVEDLAAAAAGADGIGAGGTAVRVQRAADDADRHNLAQAAGGAGGGDGDCLGAERQAVAGILDVGAGDQRAVGHQQRRADREA